MYSIDDRDRVVPYADLPAQSPGAPTPCFVANDHHVVVGYRLSLADDEWAIVEFLSPAAHYFGSPNDEALASHPLYSRGLTHYGAFEIFDSSWIRSLEQANRVHPLHNPARFTTLRHFIFTFHDNTFECIARGVRVVTHTHADRATIANELVKI